jgi:hypothetical protein
MNWIMMVEDDGKWAGKVKRNEKSDEDEKKLTLVGCGKNNDVVDDDVDDKEYKFRSFFPFVKWVSATTTTFNENAEVYWTLIAE